MRSFGLHMVAVKLVGVVPFEHWEAGVGDKTA